MESTQFSMYIFLRTELCKFKLTLESPPYTSCPQIKRFRVMCSMLSYTVWHVLWEAMSVQGTELII